MSKTTIKLSTDFKKNTTKSILAIGLFTITYFILLAAVVGLTIASIYAGIMLIVLSPSYITVFLGLGLGGLGLFILAFLIKFMFTSHKMDKSHLIEITENEQPELFKLINEIVLAVDTKFPKKVYLSAEVNAAVFYDSNFWSMFLPIKKNLMIGMALVNSVNKEELKAILAHEFGHFSQRTMKVGSYVYNVNQIIYNMLYDNANYNNSMERMANINGFITLFVILAMKINEGIQFILQKVYIVVNKAYMGLSREMEFHADEIAASITGYEPLADSLLRLNLAEQSFNNALNFYNERLEQNLRSENIFNEQFYVMNFLSKVNNIDLHDQLPLIQMNEFDKFNKSKLVIKNQWASHPSMEERVSRLQACQKKNTPNASKELANEYFENISELQKKLNQLIFAQAPYKGDPINYTLQEFQLEFNKTYEETKFADEYEGYYNDKNPKHFNLEEVEANSELALDDVLSDVQLEKVHQELALKADLESLNFIANNKTDIKFFEYDGVKYKKKNAKVLITKLQEELAQTQSEILENDKNIYAYFLAQAKDDQQQSKLNKYYLDFFHFQKEFEADFDLEGQLHQALQFVNLTLPYEEIKKQFIQFSPLENTFKDALRKLLKHPNISDVTPEIDSIFKQYLNNNEKYFYSKVYNESALENLFHTIHHFFFVLGKNYFIRKQTLLNFQASLLLPNKAEAKD